MPMYSAYIQGVIFPVLRLDPTSPVVTEVHDNSAGKPINAVHPITNWGNATFVPTGAPTQETVTWHTQNFTAIETAQVGSGGTSWLNWSVIPKPNTEVSSLAFNLTEPLVSVQMLKFGTLRAIAAHNGTFWWNVTGKLGQLPGSYAVNTTGNMTPAPSIESRSPSRHATSLVLKFGNPNGSVGAPYNVSIELATPGTSNPAIALPPLMDTLAFFQSAQIKFIVIPNFSGGGFLTTVNYLEQQFGARPAYTNSQWEILAL
jgi:hypothetical protein